MVSLCEPSGRQIEERSRLAKVCIQQISSPSDDRPRPEPNLTRQRVEYNRECVVRRISVTKLPDYENIRMFIEKPTTKQILQQKLIADSGLTRDGTLLSAVNEWRTWIVVDSR